MINKNYTLIILFTLFLSSSLFSQEFYYSNGEKQQFSQCTDRHVVHFKKGLTLEDKKNFLSRQKLIFDKKKINNEFIIVESSKSDVKSIKNTDSNIAQDIKKLYTSNDNVILFTVANQIIVKRKSDVSEMQILGFISEYNPKKIEKKWLGENVILIRLETNDEDMVFRAANLLYESGLVEFSHI